MKCDENLEKKLENTLFDKISKVRFHFFPFQVVIVPYTEERVGMRPN